MAETKKLCYLIRGVKEEIFAGLIRNPPTTLAEFHDEATTMEKAFQQWDRQYSHDAVISRELSAATLGNDIGALRELIRALQRPG